LALLLLLLVRATRSKINIAAPTTHTQGEAYQCVVVVVFVTSTFTSALFSCAKATKLKRVAIMDANNLFIANV